ncbi:MAG: hypothetical protein ACI9G1_001897, partial [Pirellulaceae bacterium]
THLRASVTAELAFFQNYFSPIDEAMSFLGIVVLSRTS